MIHVSWRMVHHQVERIVGRHGRGPVMDVYGIPRGGVVPAALVAAYLDLPMLEPDRPITPNTLVIDDLVDSGRTAEAVCEHGAPFDALYRKPHSPKHLAPHAKELDDWLVFPWEETTTDASGPADAVVRLLEHIGEDPTREGLRDTPARVLGSLTEMTAGYTMDAGTVLAKRFEHDGYTGMVVCDGIDFVSLCEHHMLPFTGRATVAYIPAEVVPSHVVGLSKLARLVDVYARRLQIQERMTEQIADALQTHLAPKGVGVLVRAHHACMSCRGVRKANARMLTSSLRGLMFDDPAARAEFMALAHTVD